MRLLFCNDSHELSDFARADSERVRAGPSTSLRFAQDDSRSLIRLELFDGQADLEAGGSWFGLDFHVAAVFADGALHGVKT